MKAFLCIVLYLTLDLSRAFAQEEKIKIGCTPTGDCASAMVAIDKGYFRRYGLDVEMIRVGQGAHIVAGVTSNSIQIGGLTPTVLLQAVAGGLDLSAVAGATVMTKTSNEAIAAFVRNGIAIKGPSDFVGKKVGSPGLGGFLDVLFRKWLIENGVDPKAVRFIEATFPLHNDLLRAGTVDAVLTAEPFVTRMTSAGTGYVGARFAAELERTESIMIYVASRDWLASRGDTIGKFRAALAEGAAIVNNNREEAAASIAKFTQHPLDLVRAYPPNHSAPDMSSERLAWWVDVMRQQDMLQAVPDLTMVILK